MNLHHASAEDVLPTLSDIGLVLVDPPYCITDMEWDTPLDWAAIWSHLHTACKPNTYVLVFGQDPFLSAIRLNSGDFKYKYDLIWDKVVPSPSHPDKYPMRQHENIAVFYNGNAMADSYRPQKRPRINKIAGYAVNTERGVVYGVSGDKTSRTYVDKNPVSILRCNKVKGGSRKPWLSLHPTQKPVPLLLYLIRTYSTGTVLDFTMGSGSTGVAANMAGCDFIGIEKDAKMFSVAKTRLDHWEQEVEHAKKVYATHFSSPV